MKKIEKEQKEVEVTTDILCDSCGESCKTEYGFEYMELCSNWGYGSDKDFQYWEAHICEKCVDEKLNFVKFKKNMFNFKPSLGLGSEVK